MSMGSQTAAPAPSGVHGQAASGVMFAVSAMFFYALMEACSKTLVSDNIPVAQVLVARSSLAFALGIGLAMAQRYRLRELFVTRQPVTQAVRGLTGVACMMLSMAALTTMALSEVITIVYSAPLIVGLLAVPFLGERMSKLGLVTAMVGFAGVLLVVQPGAAPLSAGLPYAIGALVTYAASCLCTRRLGRTDRALTTHTYTQLCFFAVCLPMLPFVWVTPTLSQALMIGLMALVGTVAMYLLTVAHQSTPPSVVAPIDYTIMMWGALFGFMIWGEVPNTLAWFGIVLIMGTGILAARGPRPLPRLRRRSQAGGTATQFAPAAAISEA